MKKKGLASLLTAVTLAAGMVTAVPVSAAETLTADVDYTLAAYLSGGTFTNSGDMKVGKLIGTHNRDGADFGFSSYFVFDIGNVDVETISFEALEEDAISVFYTSSDKIVTTSPGALTEEEKTTYVNNKKQFDLAGSTPTYENLAKAYGLTQVVDRSKSQTNADISDAADAEYLVITLSGWSDGDTTVNSMSITGTRTDPVDPGTYVAKIGDNSYTSLDAAIAAAQDIDNAVIEVLQDTEMTGTGYDASKGMTIKSADDEMKTIKLAQTGANNSDVFGNQTQGKVAFENIKLTTDAEGKVVRNIAAWANNANNSFTLTNCEITGITTDDCISVYYQNNITNSSLTNNRVDATLLAIRADSTIENATITGNSAGSHGVLELGANTTIKNSTINNNTSSGGDVKIGNGKTVTLSGNTVIGDLKIDGNASGVKLASDFTGSANIITNGSVTAVGTVVATVEEGAKTNGITVEGLDTNEYELVVNENNQLVIAEKTEEPTAAPSANFEAANFESDNAAYTASGNTLTDGEGNVTYGYKATIDTGSITYNGISGTVYTEDESDSRTLQYNGSFQGEAVFYLVTNKAINTSTSSIQCIE